MDFRQENIFLFCHKPSFTKPEALEREKIFVSMQENQSVQGLLCGFKPVN